MFSLRPLSLLSVRLPQIIGWIYDPKDLVEPFLPKQKQNEYIQILQRPSYIPPKFEPPKKLSYGVKDFF